MTSRASDDSIVASTPLSESSSSTPWRHPAVILALCLLPLMFSADSLWIDEGFNARFARQPSFGGFLDLFLSGTASDNQMPLSMLVSWIGGQVIGTSELALRIVNVGWGLATISAFRMVGGRVGRPWLVLLIMLHPFTWMYTNEARPYAMQIACGAWLVFAVVQCIHARGEGLVWVAAVCIAGVALCGSSLLGVITFSGVVLVLAIYAVRHPFRLTRTQLVCMATALVCLLLLGAFYAWTLSRGAGGARIWPVGLGSLAFAAYELGGFAGLGPSRQDLRAAGRTGALGILRDFAPYLIAIALLGVCYAMLAIRVARGSLARMQDPERACFGAFAGVVAWTTLAMLALSILVKWPFWGRHLAPMFPFLVASFGLLLPPISVALARSQRLLIGAFGILLLTSSLSLRFADRHRKDDYREAARITRNALETRRTVWWAAAEVVADYYRVPLTASGPLAGKARLLNDVPRQNLAVLPPPDLIVLSKVDVYDSEGFIREYITSHQYRLAGRTQAFTFWTR